LAIFAMAVAPFIVHAPEGLFNLMKKIGATFSVPVFALVVSGILIRRSPALGAKVIIFVGISLYVLFNMILPFYGVQLIHWLHITGFTFALLIVIMVVMSKTHPTDVRMDIPSFWVTLHDDDDVGTFSGHNGHSP